MVSRLSELLAVQWNNVISGESLFIFFTTSCWFMSGDSQRSFRHWLFGSCTEVILWGFDCLSWNFLGHLGVLHGSVNDYLNILPDHFHPMVQILYPDNNSNFQNDNAPINTVNVIQILYEKHESELDHIDCINHRVLIY